MLTKILLLCYYTTQRGWPTSRSFIMVQMHRHMLMCQRHFVSLKGSVHVAGLKIFWLIEVVPGTNAALWGHTKSWGHKTVYFMFIQLLVVSTETYRGGLKVNEVRHQNNLSTLDIHTVDLLEAIPEYTDEEKEDEEEKISSRSWRMRLLGTRLRVPEVQVTWQNNTSI